MTAYVVAYITVYEDYWREVPAVIEQCGSRYLVRGLASEVFRGRLEFPDMNAD
jgi:uncharacterized protein (DUF1330 family)